MAHKKAGGSSKNGRDSNAKRRGVKAFGSENVLAGNIIIRQKGTKFRPGNGVDMGKDFTIYAKVDGKVVFTEQSVERFDGRRYERKFVHVEQA